MKEILNLYGFHVHIDTVLTGAVVNSPAFKTALHFSDEERLRRVVGYVQKYGPDDSQARIDAIEQRIAHLVEVAAEVERIEKGREAAEAYELTQGDDCWRRWV